MATATRGVIGGTVTQAGMYPATGALIAEVQGQRIFFCTGTLIAPDAVATAAHCLFPPPQVGDFMPSFTLALDANHVTASQLYRGRAKYAHPQFNNNAYAPGTLAQTFDIGIVLLAQPVVGVAPAYLPTAAEAASLTPGMPLEITGYGQTNAANENSAGVKYHATTTLAQVGPYEIAVGTPGAAQNCMGDSGGPAYMRVGSGLRMIGIVSRGLAGGETTCDRGGIDTRTDAYRSWLAQYTTLADPPSEPMPPDDGTGSGSGSGSGSADDMPPDDAEMSGGCAAGHHSGGLALATLIVCIVWASWRAFGRRRRRRTAADDGSRPTCGGTSPHRPARDVEAPHNSSPRVHITCDGSPSTITIASSTNGRAWPTRCTGSTVMRKLSCLVLFLVGCATAGPSTSAQTGLVDCQQTPSDPACLGPACKAAPNSFACFCEQNPSDSHCAPNSCTQNPGDPACKGGGGGGGDPCQVDPQGYECYCQQNPSAPACQSSGDPCQVAPQSFECYCATYGQYDPVCQCAPNDPTCGGGGGDPCQYDPYGFECYCATEGQFDPICQCPPNDPSCGGGGGGGDPCQYDPYGFECYCSIYGQYDPACQCSPYDPSCGGGGGDPCQYDPYGFECYCQQVPQDPYCW